MASDEPADRPDRKTKRGAAEHPSRYATDYHAPVLYHAVVEGLVTDPDGVYVDATLGGGGHSAALLDALSEKGRVIGIDRDADGLAEAERRLAGEIARGRFQTLRGNFADVRQLLEKTDVGLVHGLLLDLGVSSHQLDEAERGFSFSAEGTLDMRMDQRGSLTARDVVNEWDEPELRQLFFDYGEEPKARRIAQAIVQARPVETTRELAEAVRRVVPARQANKTLARIFQAIRIAVNGEMEALEEALAAGLHVLRVGDPEAGRPGGRMAVIAYHSLEDRRAKRFFRYGNLEGEPVRDLYGQLLTPWREVTRKPNLPDDSEIAANPRARSARLRIAERIALPDTAAIT